MISLALVFIAAAQSGMPQVSQMVAVEPISWVRFSELVVFQHRLGVCPRNEAEACGGVDRDQHALRAVNIKDGKERWRSSSHPLLLGELREKDEVVAILASSLTGASAVVLDPSTGNVRATCSFDGDGRNLDGVRFRARYVDANGAFLIDRVARSVKDSAERAGATAPSLTLRASKAEGEDVFACSFALADDEGRRETTPTPDPRVTPVAVAVDVDGTGSKASKRAIDVSIGTRKRRFVVDEPGVCPPFDCDPRR